MALPHIGSWGLPDFGLTEMFTANRTGEGGSDFFANTTSNTSAGMSQIPSFSTQTAPTTQTSSTPTTNTGSTTPATGQILGTNTDSSITDQQAVVNDYENQLRNQISSGYDSYFGTLDQMLNGGLTEQVNNQNNIVQSQYDQGMNTLGTQRNLGMNELGQEENKVNRTQIATLKDVASNIRNLMQAGNNYLGARGAGDSSAVNQYSYALTKLGSKQRGSVLAQTNQWIMDINNRKSRLNEIYTGEVNKLHLVKQQKAYEISEWYANQINNLKMMKAQGELSKSQDLQQLTTTLYDQARQKLSDLETQARNYQIGLQEWAMNNSASISELQRNLAQVSQYRTPNLNYSPLTLQGNMMQGGQRQLSYGGSAYDDEDLFA